MSQKEYLPETLAIRGGQTRTQFGEHSEPLYMTSGYVFENAEEAAARFNGDEDGPMYGRITNPSVQSFERRLAALEHAEYCIATATGMAAINAIMTGLLSQGDHYSALLFSYLKKYSLGSA
jgi:O-succinylhomoserine sulfhydrylase